MDINSRLVSRYNNFDLLRLIGALLVLLSHSYVIRKITREEFLSGSTSGQYMFSGIGLAIFFTISGFLICKSLFENSSVKTFLVKRFLRIWPALFFNILFTVFIIGLLFTSLKTGEYLTHPQTLKYLFVNLSLIQTNLKLPGVFEDQVVNASLWTIPVEVKFYILLLLSSVLGILRKNIFFLFLWLIGICFLICYDSKQFIFLKTIPTYHLATIRCGIYFLGGLLLYLYRNTVRLQFINCLIFLIAGIAVLILSPSYSEIPISIFLTYSILYIGCGIPRIPFIKADLSYGIYLYAYPIQQVVEHTVGKYLSVLSFILLVLLIDILLASISWFLIERKALSLKTILKNQAISAKAA